LLGLLLLATPACAQSSDLNPTRLRTEYRDSPLGVDSGTPRLNWILESSQRAQHQSAYQILVASTSEKLARNQGDLWDSGTVKSDATNQIPYAGSPLASSQQVFWKVRSPDQSGHDSAWSKPATWTAGIVKPADWLAKWITATPVVPPAKEAASLLFRLDFTVKLGLRRAIIHVTGLGHYELSLNGRKVGEDLLAPGWTDTRKTILYDTFDVTAQLRAGANAAGIVLGNGMYRSLGGRYSKFKGNLGPQKTIAQLRLEYSDGTTETIATDDTWRVAPGPITFSDPYGGEDYDARLVQKGWDSPGFDASAWSPAVSVADSGAQLAGLSSAAPPIRAFESLNPISAKELRPGVTIYDLGQNTALIPRLVVKGPAGATVRIIPAELLKSDGDLNDTMCGGKSYWTYTLSGDGTETWFPQFYYRGARYLRVECTPPAGTTILPVVASIEGVVVHSASPLVGEFSSSSELFNRTHHLVHWAQLSNLVSVITDCPTREKLGWLEQYHLNGPSLRYDWDLDALYTKCMTDIADAQKQTGFVPNIAPEFVKFGGDSDTNPFRNSPEWGSTSILAPWQQYEFAGDLELLRRHYDVMKHYVDYLTTKASAGILDFGLGDWYDIGPKAPGYAQLTPRALTATAFYQHDAAILAQSATLLGKPEDAKTYGKLADQTRAAFNAKFYDATTHQYATGSQCANAIPLVMALVPPADRDAVLANLVSDVETRGLTAGDVGYRYLLRALANGGRSDVVFAINNHSEKPGYGYQLNHGATSLTEAWDARASSSQNHFMLGQINEWFYHDLAGIQCDPAYPGFRKIIIKPAVVGDLTEASARYDSINGPISSAWKREGARLMLAVTIPANTTATVYVPAKNATVITESGQPAAHAPSVNFLRMEKNAAVYEISSGNYSFSSNLPQ
jgi:hypothetical protein